MYWIFMLLGSILLQPVMKSRLYLLTNLRKEISNDQMADAGFHFQQCSFLSDDFAS